MKALALILALIYASLVNAEDQWKQFEIWGPALDANKITLPVQYLQIRDKRNLPHSNTLNEYEVKIDGTSKFGRCLVSLNQLEIGNRTTIVRFKLHDTCRDIVIEIKLNGHHLANSPYNLPGPSFSESCYCPKYTTQEWLEQAHCSPIEDQINSDLIPFRTLNFTVIRAKMIEKFNEPASMSVCNYVIKNNEIWRKCYGQYTGFKMFMDAIMLSMTKKMKFEDTEFFINLGDWPLVKKGGQARTTGPLPMFSWCGSEDTFDIVLPTYDITEATLENMGRVMLDMLSVQKSGVPWNEKVESGFWRGRDSRRERLDLVALARKHPDLLNASLTNFFFYRDEEEEYGPKVPHISLMDFFEYKYQISVDGTVAAYRVPYLLAGGSALFKQQSPFYEHFYKKLEPNFHYIPFKRDLSDLVEKIRWAKKNDDKVLKMVENGRRFAQENLLPLDIFCYHALLFKEYTKSIVSKVEVLPGMEHLPQSDKSRDCYCDIELESHLKDEL